jgi:DMSO/TMAO reductase YedYZ molybdopterin-dependent catalytic subunit
MNRVVFPGQKVTEKFPILGEPQSSFDPSELDTWRLVVDGCVSTHRKFSFQEVLSELPKEEWQMDIHCVTGWTKQDVKWTGVPLKAIIESVTPLPEARYVRFEAYSFRNHDTSLPLDFALENVLLAYECNGQPLTPGHGFPLRSVTRDKYFYKSVKWLRRIEFMASDRLGYWERSSAYHNNADPRLEQRYDPKPMSETEFFNRLEKRDFSNCRAFVDDKFARHLTGLDLTGCKFDNAQIKGCILRKCRLQYASCRGANFTQSTFYNVDLEAADFRGADLDGAIFRGTNLRNADFRGSYLTATRFNWQINSDKVHGARFWQEDLEALLEDEVDFLSHHGAIIEKKNG